MLLSYTRTLACAVIACSWGLSFTLRAEETVNIVINTDLGQIEAELYPERAPVTVANFVDNIKLGLYEDGRFYRAVRADNYHRMDVKDLSLIQGGRNKTKEPRSPIPHETTAISGLSHTEGILSMARGNPGTANTEFFICIGDNTRLDYSDADSQGNSMPGYAAFGKVIKGMDVVRKIQAAPTGSPYLNAEQKAETPDWILPQLMNESVIISDIEIVE